MCAPERWRAQRGQEVSTGAALGALPVLQIKLPLFIKMSGMAKNLAEIFYIPNNSKVVLGVVG